jgi:anti-sigma regulatory factor (Ser/Thr protein kinase)
VNDYGGEAEAEAAEAVVPNRPDSTPAARAFLMRLLSGWGLEEDVINDASLLTTELVSNAVRHGDGAVRLRVEVESGVVEVRVHDDGVQPPSVNHADPSSLGGRGLWIVEAVADQWGSDNDDPGKSVWFRLSSAPRVDD